LRVVDGYPVQAIWRPDVSLQNQCRR
jgi:hypothetical protein